VAKLRNESRPQIGTQKLPLQNEAKRTVDKAVIPIFVFVIGKKPVRFESGEICAFFFIKIGEI
jgi:hypothetical protein